MTHEQKMALLNSKTTGRELLATKETSLVRSINCMRDAYSDANFYQLVEEAGGFEAGTFSSEFRLVYTPTKLMCELMDGMIAPNGLILKNASEHCGKVELYAIQ